MFGFGDNCEKKRRRDRKENVSSGFEKGKSACNPVAIKAGKKDEVKRERCGLLEQYSMKANYAIVEGAFV